MLRPGLALGLAFGLALGPTMGTSGCAGPTAADPPSPSPRPPGGARPVPRPEPAIGAVVTPSCTPAATLTTLAAPSDGAYVVTVDSAGALRLWPALDGSRRPVILTAHAPVAIATVADAGAIAIALVDGLGQLELVRTSRVGVVLARTRLERDRPVTQLVATARGFIALQDDQQLVAFDVHGDVIATLLPDRGDHIVNLVARGEHVLAILDSRSFAKQRGRLLALGTTLTWAARTAPFAAMHDEPPLLSPDGTHVLARMATPDSTSNIEVVELATGTSVQPAGEAYELAEPKAFLDDHTVVFANGGELYRWELGTRPIKLAFQLGPAAVAGSTLVMGEGQGLGITNGTSTSYLHDRLNSIADMVAMGGDEAGWLATDHHAIVHLDRELHADRTYRVANLDRGENVMILDAHHVAIERETKIVVHDYASGDRATALAMRGSITQFYRSSGLGLRYHDGELALVHWDPLAARFDADQAQRVRADLFSLLDPVTTQGAMAAYASFEGQDELDVTTVGAIDLRSETPYKQLDRRRWTTKDIRTTLDPSMRMPRSHPIAASRDGSLIAELDRGRIWLHDRDGNVRWERVAIGTNLAWNADDRLVEYGDGVAFVDLETGELQGSVCGWDFGLWKQPIQTPQFVSKIQFVDDDG